MKLHFEKKKREREREREGPQAVVRAGQLGFFARRNEIFAGYLFIPWA